MQRDTEGVYAQTPSGSVLPLYWPECKHADCYNWGYAGSGPAQLAYCLLRHSWRDSGFAWLMHQDFKGVVIARVLLDFWRLDTSYLTRWRRERGQERNPVPAIWLPTGPSLLCDWLAVMPSMDRALIAAMIADQAAAPLADLLTDLRCPTCAEAVAELLVMPPEEGAMLI